MAKKVLSAPSKLKPKISNSQSLRVLVVEDSEDDVLLIIRELKKGGYNPAYERVETAAAMKKALKEKQWDIILCDYSLPKFNAISALTLLKETNIDIPLIIVSGTIGEETAVEGMRLGAQDYLMKNNLSRLCLAIARELKEAEVRSKQKQAEDALRKSEEKYRNILENIQESYFENDLAGNFTFVNDSLCRNLGYTREELIGMNNRQYQDETIAKKIYDVYNRVYRTGEPSKGIEEEYIRKDGTKGFNEVSVSLIRDAEGKPIGFRGVSREITERKLAKEALRQSEEKYRTILEEMEEAYFEVDLAGNFTFINDAECSHLGYSREELIGMNNRQYTDEENAKKVYQAFNQIYKTREPCKVFDYEVIKKDGTREVSELLVSLIRDTSRKPIGFRGLARLITERKKMGEDLRQSEEKYRTILENIEEAYFEDDLSGNFTFVNDIMCSHLGYSREELIGMNYRQYTDEKNAGKLQELYEHLYKTGEPIRAFDLEAINKNGSKMIYESSVFLMRNPKGKPIGFRGISHDITERKQAENALKASEKYFKEITENSSDIIIIMDKNGDIKYCSPSIERFTGYKPEELIGKSSLTLIHPDDKKRAVGDFGKAILARDSAIPNAFRIVHKDGSECYFEGLGKNLLDNPAVAGFIMNVHDITERKQAEDALRKNEEKYRNIIENMQEGYFELDLAGNFTFVNHAECRNLGYSKEELIGMNNRQYQDETIAQKTYQLFIRLYRTGEPVKASDVEIIRKNGTKGFNEVSVSLIRDAEGKPIGFRGISRDVTESRQAEAALRESEERYKALFDRSLDLVYIFDFEGRFIDANGAALNRLGYTREELNSLNFASLLSEDQLPFAFKSLQEIRETGIQKNPTELRIRHKNGSDVYVESIGSTIISNGAPVAIQAIARDITERKQMEEEDKAVRGEIPKHYRGDGGMVF
jgi:PAS domain S-box-containing protein